MRSPPAISRGSNPHSTPVAPGGDQGISPGRSLVGPFSEAVQPPFSQALQRCTERLPSRVRPWRRTLVRIRTRSTRSCPVTRPRSIRATPTATCAVHQRAILTPVSMTITTRTVTTATRGSTGSSGRMIAGTRHGMGGFGRIRGHAGYVLAAGTANAAPGRWYAVMMD